VALLLALATSLHAAERFPGAEWETAAPEATGWSAERLSEARAWADTIDTAAVMVVHRGRVVAQWGETERPFNCHSIRKSLLSALYGIHVADGTIDLDRTLEQLGIDDNEPSLTETERKATVRDLLKARSGIYHPALYETARMKARRPERHSHEPGTFWYYNNWDFNALGAIFENRTARSLFEEFEERLARPLGMQDFDRRRHTRYVTGRDSVHRAYPFRLSARDLARFGQLFQQFLDRLRGPAPRPVLKHAAEQDERRDHRRRRRIRTRQSRPRRVVLVCRRRMLGRGRLAARHQQPGRAAGRARAVPRDRAPR
jgi:CubicO group peptidase (beta-lactamase class C family)